MVQMVQMRSHAYRRLLILEASICVGRPRASPTLVPGRGGMPSGKPLGTAPSTKLVGSTVSSPWAGVSEEGKRVRCDVEGKRVGGQEGRRVGG